MATHLRREIDRLKRMVLALSAMVEENVQKAVRAVLERDGQLAAAVISSDEEIDAREVDVEEECLKILALHQPVAIDLRYIVAVMKMNSDLERIGDLAVNLAERAEYFATHPPISLPTEIPRMFTRVQEMLRKSLHALIEMDGQTARNVREMDDEVDELHFQMYRYVEDQIRKQPEQIEPMLQLMAVSRYLERMADHSTNIAEDVIYMIEGAIVRHRNA